MATVTLRYWAALRAAAGTSHDTVVAGTLADALAQARARHAAEARFAAVLGICAVVVDEAPVGARDHGSVTLGDGAVIELLPPFAGGAIPG